MVLRYVGTNGTKIEVPLFIIDRVREVLRELTGAKSLQAMNEEGFSQEMCVKWAAALEEKRNWIWQSKGNAEWKKHYAGFKEGDEAYELGRLVQFLLCCGGIKAVLG